MALKLNDFDPARYMDDDVAIRDYLESILVIVRRNRLN